MFDEVQEGQSIRSRDDSPSDVRDEATEVLGTGLCMDVYTLVRMLALVWNDGTRPPPYLRMDILKRSSVKGSFLWIEGFHSCRVPILKPLSPA